MADYNIKDPSKLIKKFEKLSEEVQGKVGWGATKAGAIVLRDQARLNASKVNDPKTPTEIAKNIDIQRASKIAKREKACAYRIGVVGGAKTPRYREDAQGQGNKGGATFYWRFIEFGTAKMRAQPFLRPAAIQSVPAVSKKVRDVLWKGINKATDKLK